MERNKGKRRVSVVLRLLLLVGLVFETLHVMGWEPPWLADACGLNEASEGNISGWLYDRLASWGLHHTASPYVAIVHITASADPPEVLTNTCASRAFLADLIPELIKLRASVIAIDKYYSASCGIEGTDGNLKKVLNESPIPIVIGLQTQAMSAAKGAGGCLALSPRFDLADPAVANKMRFGLIRLNSDIRQIPLHWPVFFDPGPPSSEARGCVSSAQAAAATAPVLCTLCGDGLALVAARELDPSIDKRDNSRMAGLLAAGVHPYTTFVPLPTVDAMAILCAGNPAPRKRDRSPYDCTRVTGSSPAPQVVAGKLVVIGDLASEQDVHGNMAGVDLQANYAESLLEQRFLRQVPEWITLCCLVIFAVSVYAIYWLPGVDHRKAPVRSAMVFVAVLVLSAVALLGFSYYTPIWALLGAAAFFVSRLLEEGGHHSVAAMFGSEKEAD